MRLLVTGVFLSTLVLSAAALAAGNVLVPSDNKSNSGGNLGIAPVNPLPKETPKTQAPAPTPALPNLTGSTSGKTSLPIQPLPNTPVPATMGNGIYTLPPDMQAAMATQVFQVPVQNETTNRTNLPNSIVIVIGEKPGWSPNDLMMISVQLGTTKEQIASACQLSARGMITSDKGTYMFDTGLPAQTTAYYDGQITGAVFNTMALCSNKISLGKNLGPVLQMGDRYMVMAGSTNCPAPAKKPSNIIFMHKGDGPGECQYKY